MGNLTLYTVSISDGGIEEFEIKLLDDPDYDGGYLVVDAKNPLKFMIIGGKVSHFTAAVDLITGVGVKAEYFIADNGYDSDEIVHFAKNKKSIL